MKRLLLLLAILSVVIGAHAFVSETASLENFLIRSETACAYDNWISHLAEGIAMAASDEGSSNADSTRTNDATHHDTEKVAQGHLYGSSCGVI